MRLKWKYDTRHEQWWCIHGDDWSFTIDRLSGGTGCSLRVNNWNITIHQFGKIASAKEVARLMAFG